MTFAKCFAALLIGSALAGCANMNSIHRDFDIDGNKSQLIDVKQRSIVIGKDIDNRNRPIVCAEPSPDALSVYSASLAAAVEAKAVSANLAGATGEAGEAFGLRTQSIQLLRDTYYRLCESYLSGAIDRFQFEMMLRRYGNNMVALLAIEQLTQAIRPEIVTVESKPVIVNPGTGGTGNDTTPGKKAPAGSDQMDGGSKPGGTMMGTMMGSAEPSGAASPAQSLQQAQNKSGGLLTLADYRVAAAAPPKDAAAGAGGASANQATGMGMGQSGAPSDMNPADTKKGDTQQPLPPADAVANAVQAITLDVIEHDYTDQICMTYYEALQSGRAAQSQLSDFCQQTLKNNQNYYTHSYNAYTDSMNAAVARETLINRFFEKNCVEASLTADGWKNCSTLLITMASTAPVLQEESPAPSASSQSAMTPPARPGNLLDQLRRNLGAGPRDTILPPKPTIAKPPG